MRNSGFTFVEILIVMIIMGVIATLGIPRIRDAVLKTNVRGARVEVGTLVATARAAAVQRGCRAVVHFTSGASGQAWVTACPRLRAGSGTVDTLGNVEQLGARYSVSVSFSRDSVQYSPRGLNMDYQVTTVWFSNAATQDSVMVNQLGKVVR